MCTYVCVDIYRERYGETERERDAFPRGNAYVP